MLKKKGEHTVRDSFNYAIEGIIEAIKTERHMRYHVAATFAVIILSAVYSISRIELILLSGSIALVWIAELINASIENSIDLVCKDYHILAKKAKDMAAGAVFIAAVNALVIGYFIFGKKLEINIGKTFYFFKNSYQHTLVIITAVIIVAVVWIKSYFKRGTPLHGGMPSGHSALASSIWVTTFFITSNVKIFFLTSLLMIMVMQSRIEGKIHSPVETVSGALLGGGLTYLVLISLGM